MSQRLNANTIQQDPNETLDYVVDWSDQLDAGDTITGTPAWTVTPSGLTVDDQSNTTTTTTVWLTAGTANTDYQAEVTVTTTGGRVLQGHLLVRVR